jgi:hypothetical protein
MPLLRGNSLGLTGGSVPLSFHVSGAIFSRAAF